MEIVRLKVKDLQMNDGQIAGLPKNPRQWTRDDVNSIAASLSETPELFEMRPCIVIPHEDKYVILGGNLRFTGAKKLKWKEVPCCIVSPDTSIQKQKEIVIKDNGSWGKWDYDDLANEWDDNPLTDWGVPAWEDDANVEAPKEAEDDGFDPENEVIEVRCKPGDVWELGEHRLMCGDSISLEDVKILMGGAEANLLLTDPPYNVNYEGKTKDALKIKNDAMEDSSFREFLVGAYAAADSVMAKGAAFYIWHADSEGYNFRAACSEVGWKLRQCLIWAKNSMVMGRQDYQWKHEPCLYGWKEGAGHNWYSDRKQTTLLNFDRPMRNAEHPTMKPVELFGYLINNSSKKGDNILDLFGGSGTTLVASEQLGRKAYLMELDPHYCDVIIARWEKLTSKEAKLLTNKNA